jgi:restriction endonuclease Mrr
MADPFRGVLVEGQATKVTMRWQPTEHAIVELVGSKKPIHIPFFPTGTGLYTAGGFISAICAEDAQGNLVAIDLISSAYDRGPVTEEERAELLQRLGVKVIYEHGPDFSSSPVIASITELEAALVLYLQQHPEKMREMHPDAFEKLVAELMANFGFDVEWTARDRRTAGDVIAFKKDIGSGLVQNYIIECKRYAEHKKVGVEIARALYGAKVDEQFSNALLVTTSFFESGVEKFRAKRWDFELRDFAGLVEWLNRYRPMADGKLHMVGRRLTIR